MLERNPAIATESADSTDNRIAVAPVGVRSEQNLAPRTLHEQSPGGDVPVTHLLLDRVATLGKAQADNCFAKLRFRFTIRPLHIMVPAVNILFSQHIAQFFSDTLYWVFLGVILTSITQRKHRQTASKKATATVYLAVATLVIHTASNLILAYGGSDLHMLAVLLVTVGAIAYFRERAFPFTLHCRVSGKLVDAHTFLY